MLICSHIFNLTNTGHGNSRFVDKLDFSFFYLFLQVCAKCGILQRHPQGGALHLPEEGLAVFHCCICPRLPCLET